MAGLLNAGGFNDPLTMGLLGASQALLTHPSQGGGLGAAFAAFPAAQQAAEQRRMRELMLQAQMENQQAEANYRAAQLQAIEEQRKRQENLQQRQDAFRQSLMPSTMALSEGAQSGDVGPTVSNAQRMATGEFKLTPQLIAAGLDAGYGPKDLSAISQLMTGQPAQAEFGLVPQLGINRATGKPEMYVQGKDGRTKWLGFGRPEEPSLQLVPGTPGSDYSPATPDRVFDRRAGRFIQQPLPTAQPAPNVPGAPGAPTTPTTGPAEPADPQAPWNGLPPKRADDVRVREGERIRKQLEEERASLNQESATLGKMRQFGALNRQTSTGDLLSKAVPGVASMISDDTAQMRALTASLAPRERVPGSGTTSDKDLALFVQAVPSVDKPGPVNQAIRNARQAQFNRDSEYLNAKEAYFAKRGHVNGFDEQWSKFANEVPVFADDATPNDFKLNRNAVTFEKWQKGGAKQPPSGQAQTGIGTQSVSGQVGGQRAYSMDDVRRTALSSGKRPEQVMQDMQAKGWIIR
jgi:hypothetical protein